MTDQNGSEETSNQMGTKYATSITMNGNEKNPSEKNDQIHCKKSMSGSRFGAALVATRVTRLKITRATLIWKTLMKKNAMLPHFIPCHTAETSWVTRI